MSNLFQRSEYSLFARISSGASAAISRISPSDNRSSSGSAACPALQRCPAARAWLIRINISRKTTPRGKRSGRNHHSRTFSGMRTHSPDRRNIPHRRKGETPSGPREPSHVQGFPTHRIPFVFPCPQRLHAETQAEADGQSPARHRRKGNRSVPRNSAQAPIPRGNGRFSRSVRQIFPTPPAAETARMQPFPEDRKNRSEAPQVPRADVPSVRKSAPRSRRAQETIRKNRTVPAMRRVRRAHIRREFSRKAVPCHGIGSEMIVTIRW